jgi:MFS family permease
VVSINGVLIVLLQPFISAKLESWKVHHILALGSLFTAVGFGLTAFAYSIPMYLLTVTVWTMGELILLPVSASIVADSSPQQMRGRYQAAFGLTWALASALSPLLGPRYVLLTSLPVLWGTLFALGLAVAVAQLKVLAPKV